MNKLILSAIAAITISLIGCADASPTSDVVAKGKAVIAANKACAEYVTNNKQVDKIFCSKNTMAASAAYKEARLLLTTATPAADEIEQQVKISDMATFSAVFAVVSASKK